MQNADLPLQKLGPVKTKKEVDDRLKEVDDRLVTFEKKNHL